MSAAVAFRQPLLPAAPVPLPVPSPSSQRSAESLKSEQKPTQAASIKASRGRKERPCDACRRKKSKCVMNEGQINKCVSCSTHGHLCTFLEDPRPRKRRLDSDGNHVEAGKRRSTAPMHTEETPRRTATIKREESGGSATSRPDPPATIWQYQGAHMGYTTELEPILFDASQANGSQAGTGYQKPDARNAFLMYQAGTHRYELSLLQPVESIVGTHGTSLVQHFRTINRNLPIVEDTFFDVYNSRQRSSLDPALLCSMYTVAASSATHGLENGRPPIDIARLEEIAFNLLENSFVNPTLSTIQAGLLLMQRSNIDSKILNTQLVAAAFELGLHLDCSCWTMSALERGLRKRLAWALYMEDQWCSLVHGRPSLITKAHWAVQDLCEDDFEGASDADDGDEAIEDLKRGQECFRQMVALTAILSSILETFYTQRAMLEFDKAGDNGTRLILEWAKPVQMKLKEWFTLLPKDLKMDNDLAPSTIGHLHLAYFATEITLHRCIIRSLHTISTDLYLTHVCRSAAKTRLISAMDFVNRLRPSHLTSFWYFPSKVNFALIATFGSLLLATAPCQEEAEFYRARLAEYKWTLSVSAKSAGFLSFAIESLQSSTDLLKDIPMKPKIEELDVRQLPPPPPLGKIRLIPPQEEDDGMEDAPDEDPQPVLRLNSVSSAIELASPSTSAWSAPAAYGPYIGPFAGLGARNWFEQAHHGSPETERMTLFTG